MNAIILNGSPKANVKESNSQILAEAFIRDMENPLEIRRVVKEDPAALAAYCRDFDTILLILPLYIHAMPGIVMKFIEALPPAEIEGKAMGFIIQAGFMETSQQRFVTRYFRELAETFHYRYLGTVCKGEGGGMYMYPRLFRKFLQEVAALGAAFEKTGIFDEAIVNRIATPYDIPKSTLRLLRLMNRLGLANLGWHKKLKENHAFAHRLDRPFLEEP